jgi:hypothetical protein
MSTEHDRPESFDEERQLGMAACHMLAQHLHSTLAEAMSAAITIDDKEYIIDVKVKTK